MNTSLEQHISLVLNTPIINSQPLSGGDISQAYKLITEKYSYFLKTHQGPQALHMFQAEAYALDHIRSTNTIKTPRVIACNSFEDNAFLILEYIEHQLPTPQNFETLGTQLAALHQISANRFGLASNNYIGSLSQTNTLHSTWTDFYASERLQPQIQMAQQQQLLSNAECPTSSRILSTLHTLCKDVTPSLLHGDLWSGNYMIGSRGVPYLIDPAMYYGHHEVDIAMTKLFGGFGSTFYEAYHNVLPQDTHTAARLDIYQLYYLLVHLNLFGRSYYQNVVSILKRYF